MHIILASQSSGRRKILENLGLKFEVIPADIDEEKITTSNPIALVKKIAKAKATVVAKILRKKNSVGDFSAQIDDYLIIAADSMVFFRGKTYGKPKTRSEAIELLKMFSGKTHEFITGLCVIDTNTNKIYQSIAKTKVVFGKLTEKEINDYVKIASVTSYAGGYAPDLPGGEIIKARMKFIGSKSNVLGGIPLEKLLPILASRGVALRN